MNNDNTSTAIAAEFGTTAEHVHLDKSTIDKIATLTAAAAPILQQGDAYFTVVPEGYQVRNITAEIEAAALNPRRKLGQVNLADVVSFATFVSQQGDRDSTYIYANPDSRTLVAVLNDHAIGEDADGASLAGRRDYRASYQAEYSREFAKWLANDGKQMSQEEFAVFLEDNIADIAPPAEGSNDPSGDVLLAVALTLQAKTEVDFKSHKRLDNGQSQLVYSEEVRATAGDGTLDIPRSFAIGLRLFKNGEGFRINARLKYRLGGGKLKFWYELDRPENAVEAAFQSYIDAAANSGFTVLTGRP
jgi:uncharacterized protein YfdQ (DUF2303 family)